MITNFLKIAFRNLWKHRAVSFINLASLSIGLACAVLFMLYAVNEFNYDRFHADADRVFRVYRWTEGANGQAPEGDPYLPVPLGPAMKADFPDVENVTRMRGAWGESFVRAGGTVSRLGISLADPQFFDVLTFPLRYGSPATALADPGNIVLTEKVALRLFGEANPIGRVLEVKLDDRFEPFTVSAVAEDLPPNTSTPFEALGSFEKLLSMPRMAKRRESWTHSAYFTFVKLRPGSGLPGDRARLLQFRQKYYPGEEARLRAGGQWAGEGAPVTYGLQPIRSVHTEVKVSGGEVEPVEPKGIWTLLAIAGGLLAIAGANFTTLAIGRSAGRAREVGVRKVMGSDRWRLVGQFLTESVLLAVASGLLGLLLAKALLPSFNRLADRELVFSLEQFPELGWLALALTCLTGLLAGIYPALVLSGLRPVEVLRSRVRLGGGNFFTKTLVTGQFVLSVGLVAATLTIWRQVEFMRSKNPGFDRENVVVVDASDTDSKRIFPFFKQMAAAVPQVAGVAGAELGLGAGQGWSRSGWSHEGSHHEFFEYFVDENFAGLLKLELLAGRNFETGNSQDTVNSVILNESALRDLGWTAENAIGQQLLGYHDDPKTPLPTVIGVVKNFHFRPMGEAVGAQMFHQFPSYVPFKYFVRLAPGDPASALAALKNAWEKAEPVLPFKYSFLDEDLDRFYKSEARLGAITSWAGGISVFLACLGLFGLAALAVANRQKEVGIRKVLGAPVAAIVGLLSRDFLKLVALAVSVASPVAYFFMKKWLDGFANRIELGPGVFVAAGLLAAGVAFLTVGFQSAKAALADPVKSLRSE